MLDFRSYAEMRENVDVKKQMLNNIEYLKKLNGFMNANDIESIQKMIQDPNASEEVKNYAKVFVAQQQSAQQKQQPAQPQQSGQPQAQQPAQQLGQPQAQQPAQPQQPAQTQQGQQVPDQYVQKPGQAAPTNPLTGKPMKFNPYTGEAYK